MNKTTRTCYSLLRSATRLKLSPFQTSLVPLNLVKCRHYSNANKNQPTIPKEAMAFLETLREQYKPHEDRISMEQAEANMNNWVREGDDYLNEGKLERALKSFNKVIGQEIPDGYARTIAMREHTANAYIGRAYILLQTEKPREALDDYQHLLDNFDDNPEIVCNTYHDRAAVRFQMGDAESALKDINKCIEGPLRKTDYGQSNLQETYRLRAHIYADLNMETEALADANFLLDKKKSIEHYLFRSNLYHEFGKLDEAKKDVDTADEMGADDASFWFSRSLIYVQVPGGQEEATKSLKKAFRRDPSLEREIDAFPALQPIFDNILKSRADSSSSSSSSL
eukprot:Phypoly_transcript_13333.p1 GENE.Phypoly_transcript_13333~~Phypoly_transcript_13333.p1  ORF type:complete len:349 (+),score=53.77 Phypoly_transcript_13333:33-1049(+)